MSSIDLTHTPFSEEIEVLIGPEAVNNVPDQPFNDTACSFLSGLSAALLKTNGIREYSDIISFAYWCRKSNLLKLRESMLAKDSNGNFRIGRGLAFHIAPSNIPVNFAFSFAFALLSGNANIVRVPSLRFRQVSIICDAIAHTLQAYPEIALKTAFIRYKASDEITSFFSKQCDIRIVWGGDRTIETIKKYQSAPHCKDILFRDRYSIGLIDGLTIEKASDDEVKQLAEAFYNDTYLMDQNACSTPQMIFWQKTTVSAKNRFWNSVKEVAKRKYFLQPSIVMDKYLQLCIDAITGSISKPVVSSGILTVVEVEDLQGDLSTMRGKGGYFYEHDIDDVEEIVDFINVKYQTLLYYGFDPETLRSLLINWHVRGIDRIVPFGKAMDMGIIWDGMNLMFELTRIIDAK